MKKRVHKLEYNSNSSFRLLGISCHENDYRLSWAINKALDINLQKTISLQSRLKNNPEMMEFSVFKSVHKDDNQNIYLISNRCPDGFLFPEIRNIDFFIQLFGDISQPQIKSLIETLKKTDIISAVFEIPADKIKNPGKLLPE